MLDSSSPPPSKRLSLSVSFFSFLRGIDKMYIILTYHRWERTNEEEPQDEFDLSKFVDF